MARGAYDRPDPEARARYDSLASLAAQLDSAEAGRHRADTLALRRDSALRAALAASRSHSAALSQAAARLTDTVRILLPDTGAVALFDSLGVLHVQQLAEKDVQITAEHDRAELFRARWLAADSAAATRMRCSIRRLSNSMLPPASIGNGAAG